MLYNSYILTFCTVFTVFFASAQDADNERYDFIRYDLNNITFFEDDDGFDAFYKKMDRLLEKDKGQINIMHFGGSHIQADVWSNEVRKALLNLTPNSAAGRGLVFPYKMARTNNPWNYDCTYTGRWSGCKNTEEDQKCDLGLLGMSVKTTDPSASFKVFNRKTHEADYTFNRVKVFHNFGKGEYQVVLKNNIKGTERIINPEVGYTEFILPEYVDTIELQLQKNGEEQKSFTLLGLNLESDRPGFYYHGIGVNGADVPDHLRANKAQEQLKVVRPDLVIFSIGINDAYHPGFDPEWYKANYRQLIKRIRKYAPDVAILFTTNNDSFYKRQYPNKNALMVKKAMEELCAETGAGMWDMFSIMGGLGSIDVWVENDLAKSDRIHFNATGYRVLGRLMFTALMRSYEAHLED